MALIAIRTIAGTGGLLMMCLAREKDCCCQQLSGNQPDKEAPPDLTCFIVAPERADTLAPSKAGDPRAADRDRMVGGRPRGQETRDCHLLSAEASMHPRAFPWLHIPGSPGVGPSPLFRGCYNWVCTMHEPARLTDKHRWRYATRFTPPSTTFVDD